jgi:hypothetical protein
MKLASVAAARPAFVLVSLLAPALVAGVAFGATKVVQPAAETADA